MAKLKAASETETNETEKAPSRLDTIRGMIPKIIEGISYDKSEGEIWGRTMERLTAWGATDAELGEVISEVRAEAKRHVAARTAAALARGAKRQLSESMAVQKALEG
jgi:hypothetical protein